MIQEQQLGLDELMIVNPGLSGAGGFFLGEDGNLYQVQGLDDEDELRGTGQFFLGEDGTLYQVQGTAESSGETLGEESDRELGRYFLGADGVLYEVIR